MPYRDFDLMNLGGLGASLFVGAQASIVGVGGLEFAFSGITWRALSRCGVPVVPIG